MKSKVKVFGGLGNQLFQYAFAHCLIKDERNNSVQLVLDSNPRPDRPFLLTELIKYCEHCRIMHEDENELSDVNNFGLRKKIFNVFQRQQQVINEIEEFRYGNYWNNINKNILYTGYFQHWKYIEEIWETIMPELISFLARIKIESNFDIENSILVHIRRGDYILGENFEYMGILNAQYYLDALENFKGRGIKNIIVFTDDLNGSKNIAKILGASNIIGPNQLSALQTFKILSSAKYLIGANSTFSWWAGFIAMKQGAEVAIPYPWIKNWRIGVAEAFCHPQLKTIPSKFEKVLNFSSDFILPKIIDKN